MRARSLSFRAAIRGCVVTSLALAAGGPTSTPALAADARDGSPTFSSDIAPLVFRSCVGCHRPGGAGPFPLETYDQLQKHSQKIVEVVESRYMPPWLPEPGFARYEGERRLSDQEIQLIVRWVRGGQPQGRPEDLPPTPQFKSGWQLGTPDLVATLPQPYELSADGKDVYRNFVIPIPQAGGRYIRAFEFNPGARSVIHHAFLRFDRTRQAGRLDAKDTEPGFAGMDLPNGVTSPPGRFLSWQPGRTPRDAGPADAWFIEKGSDLVLQAHLQPSGKREHVQPSVAFYFGEQPTPEVRLTLGLANMTIDIPAGATNYVAQDTYTLPVDLEVLAVLPHTHYLARELHGFAVLPDGTKQWLLFIKQWDFNWQQDYHFAQPLTLPKGTKLVMHYQFDNSAQNPRNPNHPPVRVRYGAETKDEMAELWLACRFRTASDKTGLERDFLKKIVTDNAAFYQYRLRLNPNDAKAWGRSGRDKFMEGSYVEALERLEKAVGLDPQDNEAYYFLGLCQRAMGQLTEARAALVRATELAPEVARAWGTLALVHSQLNDTPAAERCFREAIRLSPTDSLAHSMLARILAQRGDYTQAEEHLKNAMLAEPQNPSYPKQLQQLQELRNRKP